MWKCLLGGVDLCLLIGPGIENRVNTEGGGHGILFWLPKLSFTTIVYDCPCATVVNLHEELL